MFKIISHSEENNCLLIKDVHFESLAEIIILQHASNGIFTDHKSLQYIYPKTLEINQGIFSNQYSSVVFPQVIVAKQDELLSITCECKAIKGRLCEHQTQVLLAIAKRDEFRVFFDKNYRYDQLRKAAADYGLAYETDLDSLFNLTYSNKKITITPKLQGLLAVNKESLGNLKQVIVKDSTLKVADADQTTIVILKQHKYYKHLIIGLYQANITKDGKIKNPLNPIAPLDRIWQTEDHQQLKFFTGINSFQGTIDKEKSEADIVALRAVINNPLKFTFYLHDNRKSENVTATAVLPVEVNLLSDGFKLTVTQADQFFELSANAQINGIDYGINDLQLTLTYFLFIGQTLFLVDNLQILNVIELLKKNNGRLLIHVSKFKEFKTQFLGELEDKIKVDYKHVKPATTLQLKQQGFGNEPEKIIYLSDFGDQVMIIPVVSYGEVEIAIRTKRQIYAVDSKGKEFMVKRDNAVEDGFIGLIIKQHAYFFEQLENDLHYFYLHKKHFLNEDWFLNVFDEWQSNKITVLGFNELENNKLNPNKVKISIKILSGINWFNALINVRFGKSKASLKQLHKAVKNKSKYVQLDDGSLGILPADWIAKFDAYFKAAEIADEETLQIPKVAFSTVEQLYEEEMLDGYVKEEINAYRRKLNDFDAVQQISVPEGLNATLRFYQQQGLNWLNFLDDFNFGGCLADDMGLGKSLQIIAFILLQRQKSAHNTNLLVVPTSLVFNWKHEIEKFAPSINVHTITSSDPDKNTNDWGQYEVILISYGTLLSAVNFLKKYEFNYIFLDESQNIKNPESQRYKAARLLQARNRIVITGTPIENNTVDLYGQLSFACPGLLGSKQYFRDVYSIPIDRLKERRRTQELQNKIKPFILRRTKQQVAGELPEKTTMTLYCEMQPEQRRIYDAYEKEFREFISATDNELLKNRSMYVLKGLTRLRQICDSPQLLGEDRLKGEASAKIDLLMEQIESKMTQHKILVFSQFVSMLDLIREQLDDKGIAYVMLTGSTRNRDSVVNEFKTNNNIRVFLISLKAGGTGLNLTEADYVYLVDPWWNPAVENQAIDRVHRIGQHKNIVAVRLICAGTVEEKIMNLQESKKELANNMISTDTSFLSSLSKNDLMRLLS
ncbi:DEAD/DEAH box helicase [Solitalea canadensis]|uniref:DEAD/DEAH box helicase n=1 Tax=Solitalea canadensis TaxID=995 RepID=UPI001FE0863E|nr:DEAD/DEAH box helicase [Solitalea canadensis]